MTERTIFVTGATGLLGGQVLARLLPERPRLRAYVLVREPARWAEAAARLRIPSDRVTPLRGDVRRPGLALNSAVRARLAREVDATLHLAGDIVFSRPLEVARATNVDGTRNLLELSAGWRGRFCLVSTAFVAGRRCGPVRESDAGGEAGWVNAYEQSKWEAEQLVRGSGREFVIVRPSTVACDSVDGEVSQYNAVHRALRLLHGGLVPMIPGREDLGVDLVPSSYVSDGIARLALHPELSGRSVHLCAGAGAISLGELLDTAYGVWAREGEWRRRGVARPVLTDLDTYRLFEQTVDETADARLRLVVQGLSHFVPQLALEKRFETATADHLLGMPAPPVHQYWSRVVEHLRTRGWAAGPLHRVA